jgi:electron transport complex protein RnfB
MPAEDQVYRDLQEHLNRSPSGFPAAKSGADVRLLKRLLTPEEAHIALNLSTFKPEPLQRIYHRARLSGIPFSAEELRQKLEKMERQGTILGFEKGYREKHYKNVGVSAGGMIDFQVNRLTPDLVADVDRYHEESFAKPAGSGAPKRPRVAQLRTVPVEKSLPLPEKRPVRTYDDVRQVVERSPGPFSVANCICRQMKDMRGQRCRYSDLRETCLQIGPEHARRYVDMGIGRYISKDEVFRILDKAQEAGFILQPENSQRPDNICCCCGDCCGPLQAAIHSPRPADLYASNYVVQVDPSLCTGCATCVARCQLGARKIVDGKGVVDLDRCIGCGNCAVTCPPKASQLRTKDSMLVPPKDKDATMMKIMAAKTSKWDMLKLRLKMAIGLRA